MTSRDRYEARDIDNLFKRTPKYYHGKVGKRISKDGIVIAGGLEDRHAIFTFKHRGETCAINSNDINNIISEDVFYDEYPARASSSRKRRLNENHCILNALAAKELFNMSRNSDEFIKEYNKVKTEEELYRRVDLKNKIHRL